VVAENDINNENNDFAVNHKLRLIRGNRPTQLRYCIRYREFGEEFNSTAGIKKIAELGYATCREWVYQQGYRSQDMFRREQALFFMWLIKRYGEQVNNILFAFLGAPNKEQLAITSAVVGAGGSAGAAFASFVFYYREWDDPLKPFKLHAEFVLFMAMLTPLYRWPEYGSMFSSPSIADSGAIRDEKCVQGRTPTLGWAGPGALLHQQLRPDPLQPEADYLDMVLAADSSPSRAYFSAARKKPPVAPCELGNGSSSEDSPSESAQIRDTVVPPSEANSRQPLAMGSGQISPKS
jgi:hypothetical protein